MTIFEVKTINCMEHLKPYLKFTKLFAFFLAVALLLMVNACRKNKTPDPGELHQSLIGEWKMTTGMRSATPQDVWPGTSRYQLIFEDSLMRMYTDQTQVNMFTYTLVDSATINFETCQPVQSRHIPNTIKFGPGPFIYWSFELAGDELKVWDRCQQDPQGFWQTFSRVKN